MTLQRWGAAPVIEGHPHICDIARRLWRRLSHADHGYVAVDAIVALLIVALATILSLQAVRSAYQAVATASEYKRAQILIAYVMDTGPRSFTPANGAADGFTWQLVTQATGFERPVAVCRRALSVRAEKSARTYQASTREICPTDGAL